MLTSLSEPHAADQGSHTGSQMSKVRISKASESEAVVIIGATEYLDQRSVDQLLDLKLKNNPYDCI